MSTESSLEQRKELQHFCVDENNSNSLRTLRTPVTLQSFVPLYFQSALTRPSTLTFEAVRGLPKTHQRWDETKRRENQAVHGHWVFAAAFDS